MDLDTVFDAKSFFRFTGPPEHWLTAIKYMTWGLEEELRPRWAKIRPGDIFFIHSTRESFFSNARSGIIGLGVIGTDFSEKKNPLWFYETLKSVNRWPLLVPLSEIYLFSELPPSNSWDNPSPDNTEKTKNLINLLLANLIPLKQIPGFPPMGSFSSVKSNVANRILLDKRPLYLYFGFEESRMPQIESQLDIKTERVDRLSDKIKNAREALRYVDTLRIFDSVKARTVIKEPVSQYMRDNEILDRANAMHASILEQLIVLFQKHGYETRSSRTVDLFAHNKDKAFLFEIKSTENKNFRIQARKGIAQLLEYDFFEVEKFSQDNNLLFNERHKLIIPSQIPSDNRYIEFINSLNIGVALSEKDCLKPVGKDFGFSII